MKSESDKLHALVNSSGFVLQLAVEQAVRESESEHGWEIEAREYPWRMEGKVGFADLVLTKWHIRLVIEFKRTRDADWVFLMPDAKQRSRSHAMVLWTDTKPHRRALSDWDDIQIHPASPESEFCVVRGQGEKDRPLLERLAGQAVASAEGIAQDLLTITEQAAASHVVIPVIVTTADLKLCLFDPASVDVSKGELDSATFEEVPHVRFRKSLAPSAHPGDYEPESLKDLRFASVRTVLIVGAANFVDWLSRFDTRKKPGFEPWESARRRADAMG